MEIKIKICKVPYEDAESDNELREWLEEYDLIIEDDQWDGEDICLCTKDEKIAEKIEECLRGLDTKRTIESQALHVTGVITICLRDCSLDDVLTQLLK